MKLLKFIASFLGISLLCGISSLPVSAGEASTQIHITLTVLPASQVLRYDMNAPVGRRMLVETQDKNLTKSYIFNGATIKVGTKTIPDHIVKDLQEADLEIAKNAKRGEETILSIEY